MPSNPPNHKMTWRKFQQDLQLESSRKKDQRFSKRLKQLITIGVFAIIVIKIFQPNFFSAIPSDPTSVSQTISSLSHSVSNLIFSKIPSTISNQTHKKTDSTKINGKDSSSVHALSQEEVKHLLEKHSQELLNSRSSQLTFSEGGQLLTFDTTLDMNLQHFLLEQLERLKPLDRGKPEVIAMVVMEPHTGKILAMAGFDNTSQCGNPCTMGEYPAASIFKMITASAAVEKCGYTPRTLLYFNGGKYTLYKRQLKESHNKYSCKVTFANAFAESINPVFGKLGSLKLGGKTLETYATAFGFNQTINSDLPFISGKILVTENSYQWAEVASGFNKTTTISPLFGAMLAGTLLNGGKTPLPSVVEAVMDQEGNTLYQRTDQMIGMPIKPNTAKTIMAMMNKTITKGTAKKSFKGISKDEILSKLTIGGKTGSLYNREHTVKFDWFAGFCKETQGKEQIVVSVVVGHGKYIGTRASRYSRMIFTEHFNNFYALNNMNSNNG